jgi:hypothetical protein
MRHSAVCALLTILTAQRFDSAAVRPKLQRDASAALCEFVRRQATEQAQATVLEAEAGEKQVVLVADGTAAEGRTEAHNASPGQSPLCLKSPMPSLPSDRYAHCYGQLSLLST